MDDVIKMIEEDTRKLERLFMSSSFSKKKQLLFDFGNLLSLYNLVELSENNIHYDRRFAESFLDKTWQEILDNLKEFEGVANHVINMHKDIDFYCFLNSGNLYLSHDDKMDLFGEFLEYYNKDIYKMYNDMVKEKRVLMCENVEGFAGQAYTLNKINSYYLVVNKDSYCDSLFEIETLIHELTHIYCDKYLNMFNSKSYWNYNIGFYNETASLYSELCFYEWLKSKKLFTREVDMHRNIDDYFYLHSYKTLKYFVEMWRNKDVNVKLDDNEYHVISKHNNDLDTKLTLDDGIPFFQYGKEMKDGELNDFIYAMSYIKAYDLLAKEFNGGNPQRIINDHLSTFGDDKMLLHHFENMDIDNYSKILGKRMDYMRKTYLNK